MAKALAMAVALASVGCGTGSNEPAAARAGKAAAIVAGGACTNTPEDCGVKVCVDCTADAPPGTQAECVSNRCVYSCAAGFHQCPGGCFADDDAGHCGSACNSCGAPSGGIPICTAGSCDFTCDTGFARVGAGCASLSFSISY